jgi:predicted nucleic acid-binding protein
MPDRIYWDACCFLSWINGIQDRLPVLEALMSEARAGDVELFTSVESIVEVAFAAKEKQAQRLDASVEQRIDSLWSDYRVVRLAEFHAAIAHRARGLMRDAIARGWGLKPKDAIHLATAVQVRATEVQTYDDRLWKFSEVLGVPVQAPSSRQGLLGLAKA